MADDKHWAQKYLIDPLNEPDPSDETGLGTHFRSSYDKVSSTGSGSGSGSGAGAASQGHKARHSQETNPYRRKSHSISSARSNSVSHRSRDSALPTPPPSASPHARQKFPSFGSEKEGNVELSSSSSLRSSRDHRDVQKDSSMPRRRGSSLGERYPGDTSHRPLDMLRDSNKKAQRSPHLRRGHQPKADSIDKLAYIGISGGPRHHEGPYDAALHSRNLIHKDSPVAAVAGVNNEALKATPEENIKDSLRRHKPLEGVAIYPPGVPDRFGRVYNYEEGADLMRENGANYKRWPGIDYHADDLKGKGEPSFTIDRALKEHKHRNARTDDDDEGYEMQGCRSRGKTLSYSTERALDDGSSDIHRRHSTGKHLGEGIRRKFGSLHRRKPEQQAV